MCACIGRSGFLALRPVCFHKLSFRTSADLPGVERLAVVKPDKSFFEAAYTQLPELHPGHPFWFCSGPLFHATTRLACFF